MRCAVLTLNPAVEVSELLLLLCCMHFIVSQALEPGAVKDLIRQRARLILANLASAAWLAALDNPDRGVFVGATRDIHADLLV